MSDQLQVRSRGRQTQGLFPSSLMWSLQRTPFLYMWGMQRHAKANSKAYSIFDRTGERCLRALFEALHLVPQRAFCEPQRASHSAPQGNQCLPHHPLHVRWCQHSWSCWGFTPVKRCQLSSFYWGGGGREQRAKSSIKKPHKPWIIFSEVARKYFGCCSTLGECHRTTVKQDKSATATLALDHSSFFVPAAPRHWLSPAGSGTACLPQSPAVGLQWVGLSCLRCLWSRALQPGAWGCPGRGGVCKRHPRKVNIAVIRLEFPLPSATPMKKLTQPDENGGNPALPQAGRWSQPEKPRLGTRAAVPAFTEPCHLPQALYERFCSKISLHEADGSE